MDNIYPHVDFVHFLIKHGRTIKMTNRLKKGEIAYNPRRRWVFYRIAELLDDKNILAIPLNKFKPESTLNNSDDCTLFKKDSYTVLNRIIFHVTQEVYKNILHGSNIITTSTKSDIININKFFENKESLSGYVVLEVRNRKYVPLELIVDKTYTSYYHECTDKKTLAVFTFMRSANNYFLIKKEK